MAARVRPPSPFLKRGIGAAGLRRCGCRRKASAPLGSVCASVVSWLRVGRVATGGLLGDPWSFAKLWPPLEARQLRSGLSSERAPRRSYAMGAFSRAEGLALLMNVIMSLLAPCPQLRMIESFARTILNLVIVLKKKQKTVPRVPPSSFLFPPPAHPAAFACVSPAQDSASRPVERAPPKAPVA
eukprot:9165950-Pyramimonas_sp.AAC.1